MKRIVFGLFCFCTILTGCKPATPLVTNDTVKQPASSTAVIPMENDASSASAVSESQDAPIAAKPSYEPYQDGVLNDGKSKLLFFHASWCPFCRESDAELQSLYQTEDLSLSTYKIDFDTAIELKKRYGIVVQDTFVLVDGDGNPIKEMIHGSRDSFLSLLK